jgi:glycosyltransferase involved in cell wall biosynthesis
MDVVLLAPVNPFAARGGHGMALASDVRAILDNHLSLGVFGLQYKNWQPGVEIEEINQCDTRFFNARDGAFPLRFMRGLFGGMPPSLERLYPAEAVAGARAALKQWKPKVVIVDDVSMAGYIPLVREIVPSAKIILRTHNVMQDVRREHLDQTRGALIIPIGLEYRRYLHFEARAMQACDAHWAISEEDANRAVDLYGRASGTLSVSIDHERYTPIGLEEGKRNLFVHIGTLDFRRRADFESFLRLGWPKIRAAAPQAAVKFVGDLVGPPIPAPGATYTGPVKDDVDAYREGRFALNFQNTGGGIKIKTLTSLAAGRTLISTPRGVEGFSLIAGTHFWDMASFLSAEHLAEVMRDGEHCRRMGQAGREYVIDKHSRTAIAQNFAGLLEAA